VTRSHCAAALDLLGTERRRELAVHDREAGSEEELLEPGGGEADQHTARRVGDVREAVERSAGHEREAARGQSQRLGAVEHLATAEAQLDAIRGLRAGHLRLAAFGSALATFVPTAIARFRALHPDVELTLVEAEPDVSVPLLRTGEVDLALVYGFEHGAGTADGGLELVHLLDDEHRVVLPARHRLASRDAVTLADLADEAWIVPYADGPARAYREGVDRLCRDAGFAPRVAFETDDLQAAQAFVAAGLGIALMHDLTLPTRRHNVTVRPLAGPRLTRPVSAVAVAGRRSPPAEAMLAVLTD
jgi:DNA-binding transcriptional LysR family regulator